MNKLDFKDGKFEMLQEIKPVVSEDYLVTTSDEIAEAINPFEAGIIRSLEEAEAENEIKPEAHKHIEMIRNKDNQIFIKAKLHGWQELSVANQIYMVEALLSNLREIEGKND